jgi:hypothetical protein
VVGGGDAPAAICRDVIPYAVSCTPVVDERIGIHLPGFREPHGFVVGPLAGLEMRSIRGVDDNEAVAYRFEEGTCGRWRTWMLAYRFGLGDRRVEEIAAGTETAP